MTKLLSFSRGVNQAVIAICAALLAAMLGISFAGAVYQALTGDALSWTYSLARQFVPWIAMLSITVAFRNGEHVALGMITAALPAALRRIVEGAIVVSTGLFGAILLVFGGRFMLESNQLVMISDRIQFSQVWVAASVPAAGLVMLIHLAAGRDLIRPQEAPAQTGGA